MCWEQHPDVFGRFDCQYARGIFDTLEKWKQICTADKHCASITCEPKEVGGVTEDRAYRDSVARVRETRSGLIAPSQQNST